MYGFSSERYKISERFVKIDKLSYNMYKSLLYNKWKKTS